MKNAIQCKISTPPSVLFFSQTSLPSTCTWSVPNLCSSQNLSILCAMNWSLYMSCEYFKINLKFVVDSNYCNNTHFFKLYFIIHVALFPEVFIYLSLMLLVSLHSCDACNKIYGDCGSCSCRLLFFPGRIWIMFVNTNTIDLKSYWTLLFSSESVHNLWNLQICHHWKTFTLITYWKFIGQF